MNKLSDEQVKQKLQEGRNYKRLYTDHKLKCDATTSQLKQDNKELRRLLAQALEQNQTQAIQIAELQTMVFGKKRKPPTGHHVPDILKIEPKPRDRDSYRRPLPPASAITTEAAVPLPAACACGGSFDQTKSSSHDRFEEDIPLPDLTPDYQARLVTKYVIERGVCGSCGKATAAMNLGGQTVRLGSNVRLLICHLVTVVGLSYAQVSGLLLSLYGLNVSDGEIAASIAQKQQTWQPVYRQLLADIRAAPVRHYDETPWKIQAADNAGYAWVMSDATSYKTAFHCATSRGGRHAITLHGNAPDTSVHITDDYGAYRNLAGNQQLCWVHLYRVIRDLRYNDNLSENQQPYVHQWYGSFAAIYHDLQNYLSEPYDKLTREQQVAELWQQIQVLAKQPPPKAGQPQKLTRLKAQLLRAGQDRLLICLLKDTPCDNNRAERDLRQLVLKRKRSFGSKTEKGAQALATVLSICTTTWRNNQTGYFRTLALLG
jgi:transposase